LHQDQLIKRLAEEIDNESDNKSALSIQDRQQQEAIIQSDLLDTERQESELVFRALAEGLAAEHRADCSPLALLGVRLVTAPRAAAPPQSSPELVVAVAVPSGHR
jgi:hypothetical protein